MLMDYFGSPPTYPDGLGYIPDTPAHLTDWGANATRLNNDINNGAYMLLHRDHGGETGWGEPDYGISDLGGLHNEMYPFVFSINCLTGKYNWGSQCFTEAFHRMNYGALGLIAASEISYSFVNDTFIFGLFDGMFPEFMPTYGPHEPLSRFATDLRPAIGMANGKHFLQGSSWPYNPSNKDETHHLFHHHGDTFLRMYSEVPEHLTVTHNGVLFIGLDTYTVTADEGAVIALTVDGEIIGVADATGMPQDVGITPQTQPGTMLMTVTKANYYRYTVEVPVIPPDGPYLVFESCEVLDAGGDGDGVLDAGETPDLNVSLENVGIEGTTGVSATIATDDPYVTVTTDTAAYPDIPAGAIIGCSTPYALEIAGDTPDGHDVLFTVNATSNEGSWESTFGLSVEAPVIVAGELLTDDEQGNQNGRPDPGDVITVQVTMSNLGHSASPDLTGTISTTHPDVVINTAGGTCPSIAIGGEGTMGTFELEILASCPSPTQIPVQVAVTSAIGFEAVLDYVLAVGPWFDDAETDLGWTLHASGSTASTGAWIRDDPVGTEYNGLPVQPEDDHTPDPGVMCFVTGNASPGASAGTNDVDNGITILATPVFDLSDAVTATVSYWRWYSNDTGNNPGEDWWTVAATEDGTNWTNLEYTQTSAATWTEFTFNVADFVSFTDHFQMQFIAADEGAGGSLVEAAVDDFMLDVIRGSSAGLDPAEVEAVRAANGIVSISPNPFNPMTHVVFGVGQTTNVSIKVYDVHGRMVRELVDDVVEAGEHTIAFDGRSSAGAALASGIYFLRMETPDVMQVRQVTLLK
jgi:hypothetical protein